MRLLYRDLPGEALHMPDMSTADVVIGRRVKDEIAQAAVGMAVPVNVIAMDSGDISTPAWLAQANRVTLVAASEARADELSAELAGIDHPRIAANATVVAGSLETVIGRGPGVFDLALFHRQRDPGSLEGLMRLLLRSLRPEGRLSVVGRGAAANLNRFVQQQMSGATTLSLSEYLLRVPGIHRDPEFYLDPTNPRHQREGEPIYPPQALEQMIERAGGNVLNWAGIGFASAVMSQLHVSDSVFGPTKPAMLNDLVRVDEMQGRIVSTRGGGALLHFTAAPMGISLL